MTNIILKIVLAVILLVVGFIFMDNFSESSKPSSSNPTVLVQYDAVELVDKNIPERDIDTVWVETYGKEICFAGVSLRNRWGDAGQAKSGTYLHERNSIYSFRAYEGDSNINCIIKGSKILMSWSNKFKDDANRYYTYNKINGGEDVEVIEYDWGNRTSRIYPVR